MRNYPELLRALIVAALSFQLISCGTIIYPERRGQVAGRLDVGVVLLDAIGLLFFLIPGVVAFAVDFSTGAIYIPAKKSVKGHAKYKIVRFDPKHYTQESLEKTISRETSTDFHFNDKQLQYIRVKEKEEISWYLKASEDNLLALAKVK